MDMNDRFCGVLDERYSRLVAAGLPVGMNRECIPAEIACPDGYLIKRSSLHRYRRGLFVAFYGQRNPFLCNHYKVLWETTLTSFREHVLFPFHNCVSLHSKRGVKVPLQQLHCS